MVRTRFAGGKRNVGAESVIGEPMLIVPTPIMVDLQTLQSVNTPIGLQEVGQLLLAEVSGCYTEEQLRGLGDLGEPIPADQSFFYEVEFPRPDGSEAPRRRFYPAGPPAYVADEFQWKVRLERSRDDRTRSGQVRA
jgi:hypothetical protein